MQRNICIDEGDMKLRLLSAATLACWMLAAVAPASAGYWNYSCKRSVGDTAVTFDRNAFLIMPKALARGDVAGLASSEIFAFDADDNNSGFMTTMKFARGAYPDQKIVYRKISEENLRTDQTLRHPREDDNDFQENLSLPADRLHRFARG
jgi:hypothetical protein